jgi:hypothetical protein
MDKAVQRFATTVATKASLSARLRQEIIDQLWADRAFTPAVLELVAQAGLSHLLPLALAPERTLVTYPAIEILNWLPQQAKLCLHIVGGASVVYPILFIGTHQALPTEQCLNVSLVAKKASKALHTLLAPCAYAIYLNDRAIAHLDRTTKGLYVVTTTNERIALAPLAP